MSITMLIVSISMLALFLSSSVLHRHDAEHPAKEKTVAY